MFIIACQSIFIMAALNSLSDNSDILVLAPVDCLLAFQGRSSCFLVWVAFHLLPGYFGYHFMSLWILLKSCVLGGLLSCPFGGRSGMLPCYLPDGSGEVWVLHSAPLTPIGEWFLITSWWRWEFRSPLGLLLASCSLRGGGGSLLPGGDESLLSPSAFYDSTWQRGWWDACNSLMRTEV